ncbi:MAG TPA: Ig-like domain-containing protein [Spirochaetes bacterium]|nr:Ig-like domain-containing protein [Spirochaetota bacterium]
MKNFSSNSILMTILLLVGTGAAALFLSGCPPGVAGGADTTTVPVTGVIVQKSRIYILAGGTKQLSATVVPSSATNTNFTWSTSDGAVATVSTTGLVTGVVEGSATITATTDDGSFTDTCLVTVRDVRSFQITFAASSIPVMSFDFETEIFSSTSTADTIMNNNYRTNIFIMDSVDIELVTDNLDNYPEPYHVYNELKFNTKNEVFSTYMDDYIGSNFTVDVIADIDPAKTHYIAFISWDSTVFGKGGFPGDDDLDFGDMDNITNYYLSSLNPLLGGNPDAFLVGLCVVSNVLMGAMVTHYNDAQGQDDWEFLYNYTGILTNTGYWIGQPAGLQLDLHTFNEGDTLIITALNPGFVDFSAFAEIFQHFY